MRRPRTGPLPSRPEDGDRSAAGAQDGTNQLPIHHPDNRSSSAPPAPPSAIVTTFRVRLNSIYRALRGWFATDKAKIGLAFLVGAFLSSSLRAIRDKWHHGWSSSSKCQISFGTYHGKVYDTASRVGPRTCLVESKFLKVQQHQVKLPGTGKSGGSDGDSPVIPDWLWIDYHDRINVLVQAPASSSESSSSSESPAFLVFEQTKYALEGRKSLAVVGGIIEPGEEPRRAAQREVHEELAIQCQTYHFLGRYRTDVNRGMGWTNAFLASQCQKMNAVRNGAVEAESTGKEEEVVGAADTERQDVRRLSLGELKDAVQAGRFLEIQWSATVALALLHLENNSAQVVL
jgi:8-oxo-dGTP pyrophosphatase MutT (NUDIX family)